MSRRFTQLVLLTILAITSTAAFAEKWLPIDPEELRMTSVKEAPGANAVILYREIYGDDTQYFSTEYVRLKVLTEAGRKYADVELPYLDKEKRIMDISARTVHPDGSIVNFEGKPFTKAGRYHGQKVVLKTFTLPDVTVGSIIEYKLTRRWDKYTVYDSFWEVQDELFQKRAKFMLKMFEDELQNTRGSTHSFWNVLNLPAGATVKNQMGTLQLEMTNIPAFEHEENSPPYRQLAMGVAIYYGGSDIKYETFWRNEGKEWAKDADHFVGHGNVAQNAANEAAPASLAPEERLKKLYARAQQIRNLNYERDRSEKEAKAEDISKPNTSADDVIKHNYGTRRDINRAFVAMARAAGFEANLMKVSSRDEVFFNAGILNSSQLVHEIAVVRVGDKDHYLDPGTKFCPYDLLDWRYTASGGIRQIKGGDTKLEQVPQPEPRKAITGRAGNFVLDAEGNLSGTLTVTYNGLEALSRRLNGLEEDDTAHRKEIEDEVKSWFPAASDVKLTELKNWESTDEPIDAKFSVKVTGFATAVGSRLIIPTSVYANSYRRTFDHEQRKYPVYFDYPYADIDATGIKLPPGVTVETLPEKKREDADFAYFVHDRKSPSAGFIRLDRTVVVGGLMFHVEEYPKLRAFFSKLKAEDEQQVLLKNGAETSSLEHTDASK